MKNLYIGIGCLLFSLNLSAQGGQVPNPGFEDWDSTIIHQPAQWFSSNQYSEGVITVFRSTDAQLGLYSAECKAAGEYDFGYVGLGDVSQGDPEGIPYTADINTVKFWYKSQFSAGDSIYIYVIRFLGGENVGEYVGGVVSGSQSEWTEAEFSIPAGVQDHLFIAFATGSIYDEVNNSTGSWFRVDNVRLFDGATPRAALPDFSIENWTETTIENPADWFSLNTAALATGFQTTVQSADAHSGSSSVELKTLYSDVYEEDIPGVISLTDLSGNTAMSGIPYNATPTSFSGWYKFEASSIGDDDANLYIVFFKDGEILTTFNYVFEPASQFTPFSILTSSLTQQPDSVNLTFFSGENDGAILKIDDLNFSGGTVGLNQFAKSSLSVYPNPATDNVMIQAEGTYNWEIVTLSGTVVLSGSSVSGAQEITISDLNAGTYFVRLNGDSASGMHKLIVQ